MNLKQELAARYVARYSEAPELSGDDIRRIWLAEKEKHGIPLRSKRDCGPVKPLTITAMREEVLARRKASEAGKC